MEDEYLSAAEARRRLPGVKSTRTVHRLLESGALRGVRVGRNWKIPESALEEYLERNRTRPAEETEPIDRDDLVRLERKIDLVLDELRRLTRGGRG